jgi:hypothetical protein
MTIKLGTDPVQMVIQAFENLYPYAPNVVFEYTSFEEEEKYGATFFDEDPIHILISGDIPFFAVPEILSHELAHVIAGYDEHHGSRWDQVFTSLQTEYNRLVLELVEKEGLETIVYGEEESEEQEGTES